MAPCMSSLRVTAPAFIPQKGVPCIPPPPAVPGFTAYYICPLPPPEFVPWPPLAPPPPRCSIPQPQGPCVPVMHGAAFYGGVVPPQGAMAMATTCAPGPVPVAWPPRCHLEAPAPRMPRAAAPGPASAPTASSCGANSGGSGSGEAKEAAATNQPSPRSVLALAVPSPPISPTTSLPTSFPYQLGLPAPQPATAALASAAAPPLADSKGSVAVRPPQKRRLRLRGPRRARTAQVRRAVKPRRIFDFASDWTSLMIRNIPNDFTRMRLMNILDEHCFIENEKIAPGGVRSEYDFLYLPIDFRTLANKGYAFVNMTSPEAARRLFVHLHKYRWAYQGTGKTCVVDYADRQGDELVTHFSGSHFDCPTKEFLPVRFEPPRDGARPAAVALHVIGRLSHRHRAGDGK